MLWPSRIAGSRSAGARAAATASTSSAMDVNGSSAIRTSRPGYTSAHGSTAAGARADSSRKKLAAAPAGGKQTSGRRPAERRAGGGSSGRGTRRSRGVRPFAAAGGQPCRQPGDGRRLEQVARRHRDVEGLARPADEQDRQQRVPAEVEEPVVEADVLELEDLREERRRAAPPRASRPRAPCCRRRSPAPAGAATSSLPLTVSGSSPTTMSAAGTMYSGSRSLRWARSRPAASSSSSNAPSARTT